MEDDVYPLPADGGRRRFDREQTYLSHNPNHYPFIFLKVIHIEIESGPAPQVLCSQSQSTQK